MTGRKLILLMAAIAVVVMPARGRSVVLADTNSPPQAEAPAEPVPATEGMASHLPAPVRQVVKMVRAGVPSDVVKAYVDDSPSTFDLTPDGIIELQNSGIPGTVISGMLSHDKTLRDNTGRLPSPFSQPMFPSQPPPGPYPGGEPAGSDYGTYYGSGGQPVQDESYYNDLSPYGDWNYLAGSGWYWEPYSSFWPYYSSWGNYPWWGNGRWWNYPGHGWVWFPSRGFRGSGQFRGDFNRFHNEFGRSRNGFAAQNHFRTIGRSPGFNHFAGMNHSFAGTRGFNTGGGGHFGGHAGGRGGGVGGGGHR